MGIRSALLALLLTTAAAAADDPLATRYGNTMLSWDRDGTVSRLLIRPDHTFSGKRAGMTADGTWGLKNGKLCLTYNVLLLNRSNCVSAAPHALGEVWGRKGRIVTLMKGSVMDDTPEVRAVLAALSRIGNTIVAKDPDGSETRLYWRPDHTFSAARHGWKTEGTWAVKGADLFLHYNIARPHMGSDEVMKNAVPRKIGESWGMADRKVTLVEGEQLTRR